jgi:addiction module RelB/DinJ family antitoxin
MNTTLTIKTPKKLRDEAKKTAEKIGVPLTTVVNAMLRQFVLDQEITLSANVPNVETRRAIKEIRGGRNLRRLSFKEFETYAHSL